MVAKRIRHYWVASYKRRALHTPTQSNSSVRAGSVRYDHFNELMNMLMIWMPIYCRVCCLLEAIVLLGIRIPPSSAMYAPVYIFT